MRKWGFIVCDASQQEGLYRRGKFSDGSRWVPGIWRQNSKMVIFHLWCFADKRLMEIEKITNMSGFLNVDPQSPFDAFVGVGFVLK